jgi:ribosome-binding factor A
MRHQLRSIPQLTFYLDDTLDYVFKIEKLLDDIKKQDQKTGKSQDEES